jgi:hypothetical protein
VSQEELTLEKSDVMRTYHPKNFADNLSEFNDSLEFHGSTLIIHSSWHRGRAFLIAPALRSSPAITASSQVGWTLIGFRCDALTDSPAWLVSAIITVLIIINLNMVSKNVKSLQQVFLSFVSLFLATFLSGTFSAWCLPTFVPLILAALLFSLSPNPIFWRALSFDIFSRHVAQIHPNILHYLHLVSFCLLSKIN